MTGDRLRVTLCVDRREKVNAEGQPEAGLGDPGTYRGVVSVIDQRVGRVDLPLTITLSYPNAFRVSAILTLAALGGLWVAWLVQDTEKSGSFRLRRFLDWTVSSLGLLSIGAGLAAAFQAFRLAYLNNAAWGSNLGDAATLLAVSFTAFTAATIGLKGNRPGGSAVEGEHARLTVWFASGQLIGHRHGYETGFRSASALREAPQPRS